MKNKYNLLEEIYYCYSLESSPYIQQGIIKRISEGRTKMIKYEIKPKCSTSEYLFSCDEDEIGFTKKQLIESLILKEENRHNKNMKILNNLK